MTVKSLPRHSASHQEESDRIGGTQRRRIPRRGSFQGRNNRESEGAVQHVRSQSVQPREAGGLKLQRCKTDIGLNYYLSSGSQATETISGMSSPEEGNFSDQESTFRKPR